MPSLSPLLHADEINNFLIMQSFSNALFHSFFDCKSIQIVYFKHASGLLNPAR